MVKKIMRDPLFLAQKSTDATEADQQVITDLLDTLRANLDHCVGMAANMIGVKKNIITVYVIFSNEISASPESGSPKYCDRMNGCAESLNI